MKAEDVQIKYKKLFINNEFVDAVSKKTFPTFNPATEKKIADVAEADKEDVDIAVAAAKAAFARNSEWRSMNASARGRLILKLADLMERDTNDLAALLTLDNGKRLQDSASEVASAIKFLRYYAGYADKIHGNTIPADGNVFAYTRKEPIGVVGQIVPWNYPVLLQILKWSQALAAGCTIVLKPAEQTPLTALALAALTKEAGFPNGVINVLPGYGPTAGAAIALHKDVRKVTFTGSTEIGHLIMEYAAKSNLKRVSLELGGKNPLIVFDDVNVDEAVFVANIAAFANHGQVCIAGSRTFVQAGIYDEFVKKATELAKKIVVGDPFAPNTTQGPQIDKPSFEKVLRLIEAGKKDGAKLQTGGKRIGTEGYFVEPTVFSDVTDDMTIAKEEIFGPVQSILKFETLDEVIERANNTNYGLAAGIFSKDISNALVLSQAIEAGVIWVNFYFGLSPQTPFGGYKKSGFGREGGEEGLDEYLEVKTVSIKIPVNH